MTGCGDPSKGGLGRSWIASRTVLGLADASLTGQEKFPDAEAASIGYGQFINLTLSKEIQTELAYLAIPRYVRRRVDARKLAHACAFIEKSAGRMKALLADPVLNLGRLEDFAMIDRPSVCRRCNFRRLCFPPTRVAEEQPAAVAL